MNVADDARGDNGIVKLTCLSGVAKTTTINDLIIGQRTTVMINADTVTVDGK